MNRRLPKLLPFALDSGAYRSFILAFQILICSSFLRPRISRTFRGQLFTLLYQRIFNGAA